MDEEATRSSPQVWPAPPPAASPEWRAPIAVPAARTRSWPKRVGVAAAMSVLLGALGGLTAWGVDQRDTAAEWKARSEAFERKLESAEATIEQTVDERDEATSRAASFESQLSNVANEKAKLGDVREVLRQLGSLVPTINAAMQDCADAQGEVALDVAANLPGSSSAHLQDLIDEAGMLCDDASYLAGALQEVLDQLNA